VIQPDASQYASCTDVTDSDYPVKPYTPRKLADFDITLKTHLVDCVKGMQSIHDFATKEAAQYSSASDGIPTK